MNNYQPGCCFLTLSNVRGVLIARVSLERPTKVEAHSPLITSTLSGGKTKLSVVNRQHAQIVTADKAKTNQVWRFCSRKPQCFSVFVSVVVRAVSRPPLGSFKSEVHPKLQRFAPPRRDDEVTASRAAPGAPALAR